MPRLSANVSMLFPDLPLHERFAAARGAGFRVVEAQFPYEIAPDAVAATLEATGLTLDLFNLPAGDFAAGERGLASLPDRVDEFRASVERAAAYAATVGTTKLTCLAGNRQPGVSRDTQFACLVENLTWAARALAGRGITLHIETLCPPEAPDFLLHTLGAAEEVLDAVGDPNLRLQFDLYHVQRAQGDVTSQLRRLIARVGHVQVADSPGRGEPGTGELNVDFLFAELDRLGYDGRVGLEYRPTRPTIESLAWIEERGWSRDA